jgi:hypothetical protein
MTLVYFVRIHSQVDVGPVSRSMIIAPGALPMPATKCALAFRNFADGLVKMLGETRRHVNATWIKAE